MMDPETQGKSSKPTHIDIDNILATKLPNKRIPKFAVNYLKRIVHQDEINQHFINAFGKRGLDFTEFTLDTLLQVDCKLKNEENLPSAEDGKRYIFASNHPLGGIDGMIILLLLGRHYKNSRVRAFVNDLLMYLEPMQELFIPVDKSSNRQNREYAKLVEECYESDTHLVTFPAGACSRLMKGEVRDFEWRKNFIAKAIKYKRDIVPIYFEGANSKFYYRLSKWRTLLGIKTNIEMLYLADEMFRQKGKTVALKIGKPIPWQTFDKTKTLNQWAAEVRETVYKMQ